MKNIFLTLVLVALLSTAQTAIAATLRWDNGDATNNWSDGNNWSPNSIPTTADEAILDATFIPGNYTTFVDQNDAVANLMEAFSASGQTISLDIQDTGFLELTNGNAHNHFNPYDGGIFNLTVDGTLKFQQTNSGSRVCYGHLGSDSGTGGENSNTVINVNGTLTYGGHGEVHHSAGNNSTITLNLNNGATLNNTGGYLVNFSFGWPGVSVGESCTIICNQTGANVTLYTDYFTIGNGVRINTYYNLSAGNLTLNIGDPGTYRGLVIGLFNGAYGELNVSGTSQVNINVGVGSNSKDMYVGHNGNAKLLLQDSASVELQQGNLYIANTSTSTGTITQQGGSITVTGHVYAGRAGTGTYNLENGSATVSGVFIVGVNNGGSGTLEMSDGSLNIGSQLRVSNTVGARGTIRQTGGTIITPTLRFFEAAVGTATYELDGGLLEIGDAGIVQVNGAPGSVTFELDGGTLTTAAGGTGWSSNVNATLTNDVGTTDVIFVPTEAAPITWNGSLSGTGGLNLNSADTMGELTLNGDNSYSGTTLVTKGVLNITGPHYQNADAHFDLKSETLLIFESGSSVGLAATPKLTFSIEDGANFFVSGRIFAGNDLNLVLAGSFRSYSSTLINEKITANKLGSLEVDSGTAFGITINEATASADAVVVSGAVAVHPASLTVTITGYENAEVGEQFDILESDTGQITFNGSTEWTEGVTTIGKSYGDFEGVKVEYIYRSGKLYGRFISWCDGANPPEECDDTDNDGINDLVEDAHYNEGDGNNDTIPDSLQDNVASFLSNNGLGYYSYVTLESPSGTSLSTCQAADNPSPDDAPADMVFPYGLFDFTINGIGHGERTTLKLYFPEDAVLETYYKYGQTPDNPTDHWYEFLYDGETGAEIDATNKTITLHFADAKRGDDILVQDGIIVNLGGPAFESTDTPAYAPGCEDNGGCFIGSLTQQTNKP